MRDLTDREKIGASGPINQNLYNAGADELQNIKALPQNLKEALDVASKRRTD